MVTFTRRVVHEVSKDGSLYFLLNGFNGALNKLASEIGGGLRAIALALSTPKDNSAEVQKQIDQYVAQLRGSTDKLDTAVKETKGE
jgi:formiminotetrahydrofolate cyclodeaminase